jgi:hypothetical protein
MRLKGLVIFALVLLWSGTSSAATVTFSAGLSGTIEVPPNTSPGTGSATAIYDSTAHSLRVIANFSNLQFGTTAAHIHCCTSSPGTGTAAVAVVTPTLPGFPLGVTAGTYDQTFDLTNTASYAATFVAANGGTAAGAEAALLAGLLSGSAYFNIHTDGFGGGEIRGFLLASVAASDNVFQLKYFNTNYGSGHIIVSNAGTMSTGNNAADDSSGTVCANFYSFDPNEEMQTCCSCPVTPNGLSSLNVNEDIIAQNLIVNPSSAITVKLVFTLKSAQNGGNACDPTKAGFLNVARGGLAWGTNLRNVTFQGSPPTTVNAVTETRFTPAELSAAELAKLSTYCQYIKILGSSVSGICKSCQAGARGSIGQ